eukprot:scaffold14126_cov73-Skeletonema_marinoi.AAC.2
MAVARTAILMTAARADGRLAGLDEDQVKEKNPLQRIWERSTSQWSLRCRFSSENWRETTQYSMQEIIDIIASHNQSHENSGAWNRFAIMEHRTTI